MRQCNLAWCLLIAALVLSACQSGDQVGTEPSGSTGGSTTGLLGNGSDLATDNPGVTLTGSLLDEFVGGSSGGKVDKTDRQEAFRAEKRAYTAPIGQNITWNNPHNGSSGVITATADAYATNGQYCRDFSQMIVIRLKQRHAEGRACQLPDTSWQIVTP